MGKYHCGSLGRACVYRYRVRREWRKRCRVGFVGLTLALAAQPISIVFSAGLEPSLISLTGIEEPGWDDCGKWLSRIEGQLIRTRNAEKRRAVGYRIGRTNRL